MPTLSKSRLVFGAVSIAAAGCFAGAWHHQTVKAKRWAELLADAERCALAFRTEDIAALSGNAGDEGTREFSVVKAQLRRLRGVHADVRHVRLVRRLPKGDGAIYLADSAERRAGSGGERDRLLLGDVSGRPGLLTALRYGRRGTEGPVRDASGVWVAGYVPVAGLSGQQTGEMVVLEVSANGWTWSLLEAGFQRALYVWLLLGLPLGAYGVLRRYSSQAAQIRKLHVAVEQSASAIMIVDLQSRIEYANAGLCRQMGYEREEIVGKFWRDFRTAETPEALLSAMVTTVREGRSWEGEWVNRRKSGERYPARGQVSPVRGADGKLAGFIAVIADASEMHRQEETLRREKERAEAADKAKGAFLATMSHEVRTPLNGIVGFTTLLLETPLTPEQRECVQTIRTSGEALVHLTGDILDFSRLESGGLQLEATTCDVRGAIEDVLDIFAGKAGERDIELLHAIDPDVPVEVLVDVGRLRQVLVNLVGNALKFTPSGEVEVSVRLLTGKAMSVAPFDPDALSPHGQMVAEFEDGSLTLEFAVRDTGIGIAAADRARLFQPFSQLDTPMTKRFSGAGLGLVISRNLVRVMGGDIWLESEPGAGATFFFTVRCRRCQETIERPLAQPLVGRRVAVVIRAEGLRNEILHILRVGGAEAFATSLEELATIDDVLAVVDCEPSLVRGWADWIETPGWRKERSFGLVTVKIPGLERQRLRPYFRMLLNKPLHHRTLINLLAKAGEAKGERAKVAGGS